MDGARFDQLARKLSSGASRRRVLGGLIAGAVGTALGRQNAAAQICTPPCDPQCEQCVFAGTFPPTTRCVATVGRPCASDNNPCTADVCGAVAGGRGTCQHQPISGPACPTGDPCAPTGTCQNGQCRGGTPKNCPGDACNIGACDPRTGDCITTPVDCSRLTDACNLGVCDPNQGGCIAQPKITCPGATVCCPTGKFAGKCRAQAACDQHA
jgi:hypothetical protein